MEAAQEKLQEFDRLSKSGVGMHMFKFQRPAQSGKGGDGDEDIIYVASEVTDENNVLDVKYSQWAKTFALDEDAEQTPPRDFVSKPSQLKVIWRPTFKFSSGRVAMVAVMALLHRGYQMSVVDAEAAE